MAVDIELTEPERRLVLTVRALPPTLRERLTVYVASLRREGGVPGDDAEQRPGGLAAIPGTLRMTDTELREMGEFLRACDEVEC